MNIPVLCFFQWICVYLYVTNGETECQAQECEFWDFECLSGHCINMRYYCDGHRDCPDGSDEIYIIEEDGCSNTLNTASLWCSLPSKYFCDGTSHCVNKFDEHGEVCKEREKYVMKCTKIGHCINKFFLNCSNRSDWSCSDKIMCKEDRCTRRGNETSRTGINDLSSECESTPIFRCGSGECLSSEKFCDGKADCADGSDEATWNESAGGVNCRNRWNNVTKDCMLPAYHMCDRIDHCDDRIDECQPGCPWSFICDNGRCLSEHSTAHLCDGKDDCGDSSDECSAGCEDVQYNIFTCNDGTCLAIEQFCDGRIDCPDGSDEVFAGEDTDILCKNRKNPSLFTCVLPRQHVCDDVVHCRFAEDERMCNRSQWFTCQNDNAVHALQVCNFKDDCCDSSDECLLREAQCNKTFICPNNGKCIAFNRFCDGVDDCGDGSDEISKDETGFFCNNEYNDVDKECILPRHYICDDMRHCKQRKDECAPRCHTSFLCNDGECLPRNVLCDGKSDCKDGSDEMRSGPGFKCIVNHQFDDNTRSCVLPQRMLFDAMLDCRDQSDVCSEEGKCFRCVTEDFLISARQVCDGIVDCVDLSDECLCEEKSDDVNRICDNYCLLKDSVFCTQCKHNDIICGKERRCVEQKFICDGTEHCDDKSDENVCGKGEMLSVDSEQELDFICDSGQDVILATQCNGKLECPFSDDECSMIPTVAMDSSKINAERYASDQFVCGNKTPEVCKNLGRQLGETMLHCPGARHLFLLNHRICDGIENCPKVNNSEIAVDEQGCDDRVRCGKRRPKDPKKITIHKSQICDFQIDCEGEEDEAQDTCIRLGQPRFYCENRMGSGSAESRSGPLFVSRYAVLDGNDDCMDGSDECPTELFTENKFSSNHRMIRNMILSVIVWLMSISALFGNFSVMLHTILKLRSQRRFSLMIKSNYILVFNLAAADFLMGIYLLALAIQNAKTSGRYCHVDRDWRCGATCSAIGSLAMISIQASVLFLALLTTYRMVAVLRPFRVDTLRVKHTHILALLVWIFTILIAIIPRIPQLKDYFVSSVWISPQVYFFKTNIITKQEFGRFAHTLALYRGESRGEESMIWEQINNVIQNTSLYPAEYPRIHIKGEFGYYSVHSVCLPKLFVTVEDNAWGYSVILMTLDFFSFVYIAVSYIVLYCDAARVGQRSGYGCADENKILQSRITRLVLTDFLCLVPVCLTAFLSICGVRIYPSVYAVAAIVFLPINSALNPILYSNILNVIRRRILQEFHKRFHAEKYTKGKKIRGQDELHESPYRSQLFQLQRTQVTHLTSQENLEKIETSPIENLRNPRNGETD